MADIDQLRTIRFGLFEVDQRAREVRKNGVKVKLQDQPFRVLITLLRHAGDVVTREELRQELWPSDTFVDFEHGLNAAVKRLRDALDDSVENPRFIETLPRHGYRFVLTNELQATQKKTFNSSLARRGLPLIAVILVMALALYAVYASGLAGSGTPGPSKEPQ